MKKRLLFISAFVVVVICSLSVVLIFIPTNATNEKLDKGINKLKIDFQEQVLNQSELSFSSNPYDYVKENENFTQIVDLGYRAIPAIQKKMEESSENGLVEYTLAIAAEEIAQTDLKVVLDGKYKYETAKGFCKAWNSFTDDLKSNVNAIIEEEKDTAVKNEKLEALGIFAIPYLVDAYKAGEDTLAEVILELSKKIPEMQSDNLKLSDVDQLIKDNKDILSELEAQ